MSAVKPKEARKAILKFADVMAGICDALDALEGGAHPIVAVQGAIKKAKKRKKNKKAAKRALKREKRTVEAAGSSR